MLFPFRSFLRCLGQRSPASVLLPRMEDNSERFLLLLRLHLFFFSRSNLCLFRFWNRPFSFSFSFAPRLDGHRSRSIALSHSRISPAVFNLSLSLPPPLSVALSLAARIFDPCRSCAMRFFSLSLAQHASHSTDSRDRRSLHFSLRRVATRVGCDLLRFRIFAPCYVAFHRVASFVRSFVHSLVFCETKRSRKRRIVR